MLPITIMNDQEQQMGKTFSKLNILSIISTRLPSEVKRQSVCRNILHSLMSAAKLDQV